MKLSKMQVVLIAMVFSVVLVVAGVFIFREPLKTYINGKRAGRLQGQAELAFEEERWDQASRLAQAAHYLDSDNTEIVKILARSLLKQRMGSAVGWWKLILNEPDLPVEELRAVTSALLGRQELAEALPFLSRLVELDGDNPETRRLWLSSLQLQRRYGKARNLVSEFALDGSEDWQIHRAYMLIGQGSGIGDDQSQVIQHLLKLLEEDGLLALNAARELVVLNEVSPKSRAAAIKYLKEHGKDDLDLLYASSAEVKDGLKDEETLVPILDKVLTSSSEGILEQLLDWAKWMKASTWFLERVEWERYRENGGEPDAYLALLLEQGKLSQLLEITEASASKGDDQDATHLYYRSVVLEKQGELDRARQTLQLSVQTVDPANSSTLERYLIRDGRWTLLADLYQIMLENNPEDKLLLIKALGSLYYVGDQERFGPLLDRLEMGDFMDRPDVEGFLIYLHLLNDGFVPEIHQHLESIMVTYPEVFDFRLILGVSYILQGRESLAEGLLVDMPTLDRTAPRFMRVAGAILGLPAEELLLPAETEYLLPREQYLISLQKLKSTR